PAKRLPIMTESAPAANALVISPENLIPPSAMIGMFWRAAALAQLPIAVIGGPPTPETTRVLQIDPGPTPTFTTLAPACINAEVPSSVATLPAARARSG